MANTDLFDVYFRRADLDRDGRISGTEAVTFLQASGLPRQVLAQVWTYADQNRIGFLGRAEFYNALKLVTVAQKNKELTPDIVRAALFSPASAKIPAPQINLNALPAPQSSASAAAPASQLGPRASVPQSNTGVAALVPQMGPRTPTSHQNPGLRGPQALPNSNVNPQLMSGYAPRSVQGAPGQGFPGGVGGTGARPQMPHAGVGMNSHMPDQGMVSSVNPGGGVAAARPPRPPAASTLIPQDVSSRNIKAPSAAVNGTANTSFGGDAFSSMPSQIKQGIPPNSYSAGNIPGSAAPGSAVNQPSVRASPHGGQFHPAHSHMKQTPSVSAHQGAGLPRGDNNSEMPWPKITQSNIQKYTKVFLEVDKDRDGKITGEEARNLFLSWRLPREVLMQVWDLSDQDNDSMLSHKEFCIALYLMERFREGRRLPAVLPIYIMSDFPTTSQLAAGQANAAWRPQSGWKQQQVASGVREKPPTADTRQPLQLPGSEGEGETQAKQQKSRVPVLEKHLVDQLSKEEQESLNSKFKEAAEAEKKVEELEKEIVESRQKIEFYHAKMQELILYKSRCDNRLNEITERVSADKREVEVLAKKYEEKYKQSGDVASRLTIEEATFRDIQEKKMEIYQAIVKMEQAGSGDGVIQGRADHIQSDLDELVKALNDRCKKYGLRARPTAIAELPFGWQPGIQEGAADWDEDWDKFEDEGYSFVKELTLEVQNVVAPPKLKTTYVKKETSPVAEKLMVADIESENAPSTGKEVHANGSRDSHGEGDSVAPGTPTERVVSESTSREDSHFEKSAGFDASPHGKGSQSEHGGTESVFSGDKRYDEPAWGTFDTSDDMDSVWGNKGLDHDNHRDNYLFDSGALGLNPIKTGMPKLETFSSRKNTFAFDESVPSPPATGLDGFFPKQSTFGFDESVPSTPATVADGFFPKQSTFGFDESVPSTPATGADGFFPKRGTFGFDESVPSTPATGFDDFFTKGGPFGFDESVPSTPATGVDGFFPKQGPFGFDESVPSTPAAGADGFFPQHSTFGFDESVPSTPAYGATTKGSEYSFDSFSRFDSFNSTQDSGLFQSRETLSRFDSMRSTSDFDHGGNTFARFDSMRSTADFDNGRETLTRFDSMRSTTDFDHGRELGRFDSMRSTNDFVPSHGFSSFDDSDPFGSSGPFKISFDSQTPKKGSDNWNAF